MRSLLAVLVLAAALSGCQSGAPGSEGCFDGLRQFVYHVQPDGTLARARPAQEGAVAVPGFRNAFLEDDPKPLLSEPLEQGLRIVGNVTLKLWVRSDGGPAPLVDRNDPTSGYHLFVQHGSDRALAPAYVVKYGPALPLPGQVAAYDEAFRATPGGFVVEAGDRLRLLVTSLVADEAGGHNVLVGGARASRIGFVAVCEPPQRWTGISTEQSPVVLPGNQGLLTGAIPTEQGVNQVRVPLAPLPDADRITVRLVADAHGQPKDDIDITLIDAAGSERWSGGSPAIDETIVLYRSNLQAIGPGPFAVRVDSYSGVGYSGTLTIVQESGSPA